MVRCGAAALLFLLTFASPSLAAPDYVSRPGTVPHTLALPNGVEVTLDNVVVELIIGPYLFVRDPWNQVLLPVYAVTYVERWTSVEVTGVTATVSGKRIVEATRIRQYVDFRGRPMLMLPKGTSQPYPWSNMRELSLGQSRLDGPSDPPEPTPPPVSHGPLTAQQGTIAYAKLNGGSVTLEGKVVTAVFRRVGNATIDFFYIQEQDCPSGIKVVPPASAWEVEPGDVVTVEGTVVGGDSVAECYIDADDVDITGTAPVPAPVGMTNKATAGAEFGDQQALYLDSSDASKIGSGLNAVGTRVRVWGSLVMASGLDHYIDDGSRLLRNLYPTQEGVVGLRIESWEGYSMPTYVSTHHIVATGILGAEMDGGILPVPVVRIPGPPPRCAVKVAKPGTGGWPGAYETIQDGINAAASQSPKGEVWVADGIYEENILIPDGVAVYGGFGGREDKREQRMIHGIACPTVIDGGGSTGPVVAIAPNATPATRIDGFTVRNGALITDGAGIACGSGASPTIANNYIAHNSTALGDGAGVWSYGGSPCIWSNWIHSNNDIPGSVRCGGGIFCRGGSPVILFNVVEANYAGYGAGIYCTASRPAIIANRITDNQALLQGGGIAYEGDDALIAHNMITKNRAGNGGGAILCVGNQLQYQESWRRLRIVGNRILENDGGSRGGGLELRNCGWSSTPEEALVANNVFYGNFAATDATDGGGLAAFGSRVFVVNNTFVGNYVENESYDTYGGAISSSGSTGSITRAVNNIFDANNADLGCAIASTGSEDVLVAYCDAFPLDSPYYRVSPDAGCMWDDPKLCADSEEAPWAPQPISPIRTTGVNPSWANGVPTVDIFGRPRPGPNGTTDMGAYEDTGDCRP